MPSPLASSVPQTQKPQRSALSGVAREAGDGANGGSSDDGDEVVVKRRVPERITIADRGLSLGTRDMQGQAKVDINWQVVEAKMQHGEPAQRSPAVNAVNSLRSSSPSSPSSMTGRPVTPRHWLTGREDDLRRNSPHSPEGRPLIDQPELGTPRGHPSPWLQEALGRSGHILSPQMRPLPATPRDRTPRAQQSWGGSSRSPYISGGSILPLGPRVTASAPARAPGARLA